MEKKSPWHETEIAGDLIGERLQTISILTREIEKKLSKRLGVNLTDLAAMEQLITSRSLTPSELASRLNVTTAASTQIVDRLERVGHVARERQSDDRRKVLVVPHPASVDLAFQELAPMMNGLDAVVASLSEAEREVVERFLGRVVEVYGAVLNPQDASETPS